MMRRITLLVVTLTLTFPAAASAAFFQFSGRTSQSGTVKFRVDHNFARVSHFVIYWKADCTSGASLVEGTILPRTPIDPFPRFQSTGSYVTSAVSYSAANGRTLSYVVSGHLRGILPRNAHAHGTWTATVQVRDTNQNVIDNCTTGIVNWHARLA